MHLLAAPLLLPLWGFPVYCFCWLACRWLPPSTTFRSFLHSLLCDGLVALLPCHFVQVRLLLVQGPVGIVVAPLLSLLFYLGIRFHVEGLDVGWLARS